MSPKKTSYIIVRKNPLLFITALIVVISVFLLFFKTFLAEQFFPPDPTHVSYNYEIKQSETKVVIILSFFILISLTFLIYSYLQGSARIRRFKNANEVFEETREEEEKKVQAVINSLITQEVLEIIDRKYSPQIKESKEHEAIEKLSEKVSRRFLYELENTKRSASINLSVGFFTTVVAIGVLVYTLIISNRDSKDLYFYIPRITLSIFIEIFSFFFLRLYKKNLEDLKYINNEMTNIEMKMIGLEISHSQKDSDLTKKVVEEYLKTERNFILKKGYSTVELEKIKIDSNERNKVWESAMSVFKKPQ